MKNCSNLVSVIIPVYNVSLFLGDCLKSVLKQTHKDLEIICVDDGSTDQSTDILKHFDFKDRCMKIVRQDNAGLSAARNTALDLATGDYVFFLDSDDFIHPQTIEILLRSMQVYPHVNAVACRHQQIQENQKYGSFENLRTDPGVLVVDNALVEWLDNMTAVGVSVWNKLYRRCVFKSLRFAKQILWEDLQLEIRLMLEIRSLALIQNSLYYYRVRDGSLIRGGAANKKLNSIYEIFTSNRDYLVDGKNCESVRLRLCRVYSGIVYETFCAILTGNKMEERVVSASLSDFSLMYHRMVSEGIFRQSWLPIRYRFLFWLAFSLRQPNLSRIVYNTRNLRNLLHNRRRMCDCRFLFS